jgi:hypothetical protein
MGALVARAIPGGSAPLAGRRWGHGDKQGENRHIVGCARGCLGGRLHRSQTPQPQTRSQTPQPEPAMVSSS